MAATSNLKLPTKHRPVEITIDELLIFARRLASADMLV